MPESPRCDRVLRRCIGMPPIRSCLSRIDGRCWRSTAPLRTGHWRNPRGHCPPTDFLRRGQGGADAELSPSPRKASIPRTAIPCHQMAIGVRSHDSRKSPALSPATPEPSSHPRRPRAQPQERQPRHPRNRLVVFTGVSGSGKSSLAFAHLYAKPKPLPRVRLSYARRLFHQLVVPKSTRSTACPRRRPPTTRGAPTTPPPSAASHPLQPLRMLYSRAGDYPPGQTLLYAESFSPNTPEGACPRCHGRARLRCDRALDGADRRPSHSASAPSPLAPAWTVRICATS